jgi:hypothetical protein
MDDNPYNSIADIELFMSWLTEEERETRRTGIPAAYSGIIYREFDWNVHVRREPPVGWVSWLRPPDDHCIRFAIDYHPRKPHHVLFIATSPHDQHYVYAEIFRSCLMSDLVADIRLVLGLRDPTVPGLIDPLANTPNQVTDVTALEEVIRLGLPVMSATKDPHNGILKTKAELRSRDRTGQPTMIVNAALSRFLFEISRGYIWDGETNKPKKENDDAMENFYRLCLQGLQYVEPSTVLSFTPPVVSDLPPNVISPNEFSTNFEDTGRARKRASFASRYRS